VPTFGRKPSYTRDQLNKVRDMLGQEAVTIAQIARDTGLSRQTIYRIKDDPAGAEAALAAWNYNALSAKLRATLG
jgi:putative DNA-invertase from lambdoid prophage Rac